MPARLLGGGTPPSVTSTKSLRRDPDSSKRVALSESHPGISHGRCPFRALLGIGELDVTRPGGLPATVFGGASQRVRCIVDRGRGLPASQHGHFTVAVPTLPLMASCHRPASRVICSLTAFTPYPTFWPANGVVDDGSLLRLGQRSTGGDDVQGLAGLENSAVWAETYVDLDRLAVVDKLEDFASPPLPGRFGPRNDHWWGVTGWRRFVSEDRIPQGDNDDEVCACCEYNGKCDRDHSNEESGPACLTSGMAHDLILSTASRHATVPTAAGPQPFNAELEFCESRPRILRAPVGELGGGAGGGAGGVWSWGESNPRPSAGERTCYDHSRHCH